MPTIVDDRPAGIDSDSIAHSDQLARELAIKQIERRRRFRFNAVASVIGMIILVAIWAITEYHNAGGWPTNGFSQSSGIHDVWNSWIIYPIIGWAAILGTHGWFTFMHKPISESDVKREIERQTGHAD